MCIYVYKCIGVQLFKGALKGRCYSVDDGALSNDAIW